MIYVVHSHERSHIRIDLEDKAPDLITGMIWGIAPQKWIYLHRCGQPSALIHVQCRQAVLARRNRMRLLFKRKEQIALQAHIQECADV